jgi:hypothetical protein
MKRAGIFSLAGDESQFMEGGVHVTQNEAERMERLRVTKEGIEAASVEKSADSSERKFEILLRVEDEPWSSAYSAGSKDTKDRAFRIFSKAVARRGRTRRGVRPIADGFKLAFGKGFDEAKIAKPRRAKDEELVAIPRAANQLRKLGVMKAPPESDHRVFILNMMFSSFHISPATAEVKAAWKCGRVRVFFMLSTKFVV